MLGAVASLAEHARASYETGRGIDPVPALDGITSVAVCGMG